MIAESELEKKGITGILINDLPPGAELFEVTHEKERALYQLRVLGKPVQGKQAAVIIHNHRVLISCNLSKDLVFETSGFICANNCQWISIDDRNFELYEYRDSFGFRIYQNGQHHFIEDQHRYISADTQTKAWVFLPDPLSRANRFYGGIYKDRGDSSYAEIELLQTEKMMQCVFENDSFRLGNRWLRFGEVSPPFKPHAVGKENLQFRRNEPGFEEVNAFWHINELSMWWDSLGFGAFRDTVLIDAHAFYGADESAFDPTKNPPTIEFGDGGVDDAEDADSPVHEYTHAAFNHLVPGSYSGTERKSVEEGICDFMAVCYSLRYTGNQAGWVYNWDGHNEFWEGRSLINDRHYPEDITSQTHVDGQLFAAALYELAAEIGTDSCLKILMNAMPLMVAGMNMRNATRLIVQVDSLINDGRNSWPIIKSFYPHGLMPDAGIVEAQKPSWILKNSQAFAQSSDALEIFSLRPGVLEIYTSNGKLMRQFFTEAGSVTRLYPDDFVSGVYVLRGNNTVEKFIKF